MRKVLIGAGAVVVAGVAAVAVALAVPSGDGPAPSEGATESPAAAGVYAYMRVEFGESWMSTQGEMVVMDGTERIGGTPFGLVGTRPVFTTDGRYVFTVILGDELGVVSTENGEAASVSCEGCGDRQLECQCQTVVPVGGSRVAWLDGDDHVVVIDLADASPEPQRTDVALPTEDGFLDERVRPHLIAGTDGAALAAYPHGSLPGDDVLPAYLVPLDGEPRRLDPDRPDSIEEAAFSPDGTRVLLTGDQEYACATVTVVDVASGEGETAPVHAEPGEECETHDVYIDALWWDPDGTANVYFQVDEQDAENNAEEGQRRLDGERWVETGTDPLTEQRSLTTGVTVALRDWTLSLDADGERTEIATDVRYVTAAPAT
ncbi:WD40 repeat domain-containing protein [Nocardiopsis trehalosi]|jgi:hypothetical protein|uniref:hypothetical protein n=1 Tax=Nocardiopsis trehalosi TaxID=109329 RepID=UPI00082F5774|nr:hypothetical protein [Nocardiopsis trehalosi]